MRYLRVLIVLVAVLIPSAVAAVETVCAPDSMVKVVTRLDVPGFNVPPDHDPRVPKTYHLYGLQYVRVEQGPALEPLRPGLDSLTVVNGPDIWMGNPTTGRGLHIVDPGRKHTNFRARLLPGFGIKSPAINRLEVGCEIAWLKASGAIERAIKHPMLGVVRGLEYSEGVEKATLYERSGKPVRFEVTQNDRPIAAVDYLEYASGLPFEAKLFEKPSGITFEENDEVDRAWDYIRRQRRAPPTAR